MRAEGVVFRDAAPGVVHDVRALGARADAVAPVVAVGEAAAGPAEVRDPDSAEDVDHVLAHAVDIRDFGLFPDEQAVVDTVPEMFGELAVDMAADPPLEIVRVDNEFHVAFLSVRVLNNQLYRQT